MLATSRPSPKASPSLPSTSPFPNLPMFQVITYKTTTRRIIFNNQFFSPLVHLSRAIPRSMLERRAPCTTHPWSQPVPRSSRPPPMSRPSPTHQATPCRRPWRLQNLQATLGGPILEALWGRDLKVENYLQVLMIYIIQVTKRTGTVLEHIFK